MLERFAQLVEQARVLDGDDRLSGEILYEFDLLVGKGTYLLAKDNNCANQLAFPEHWHHHDRPRARDFDEGNDAIVFPEVGLIGPKVVNVDNLFGVGEAV